jgi:hypothetical protein
VAYALLEDLVAFVRRVIRLAPRAVETVPR